MAFWRIVLTALGAQLIGLGGVGAFIGLAGAAQDFFLFSPGWFDLANNFIPLWLACVIVGGGFVLAALEPRRARTVLLSAALVSGIVSGVPVATEFTHKWRMAREPRASGPELKLLTFNAWNSSFAAYRGAVAVRDSGADVVALQEVDGLRPFLAALATLYPYQTPCEDGCSVIILSKVRPSAMGKILIPGASLGPIANAGRGDVNLAHMTFPAADGRPITLVTTHLRWPGPPIPYERQQDVLAHFIGGLPKGRLILTGDFNLTPWAFAMRRQDALLAPLNRVTRALPTWPAYFAVSNKVNPFPFLPLDHIYVGPEWQAQRVSRMSVYSSDHLPVLATLRLRTAADGAR